MSAFAKIQFPDGATPTEDPEWTAHVDELRTFVISISGLEIAPFQPGDSISVALEREGDHLNDTCPTEILISGLSVTYQGHSSYLPIMR